jgi:integrase
LPFNEDEMERILKTATGKDRAFVLTMRFSGLRISDVCKLERESLVGDELRLRTHKTGTSVRVPIPKEVGNSLRQTLNQNPKYFFWTGHSLIPTVASMWRSRLSKVFKLAKVHGAHPHRFRDTFAVGLLQAGVSMENVSVLLGHENLRTTQHHYSPWVQTRQDRLSEEVARANRSVQI